MKRIIKFTKIRWIMIGMSIVLILGLNLYTIFVHKKMNLGIDFAGGMTMQVQIAPVAMNVQYQDTGSADLLVSGNVLHLKINRGEKAEDYSLGFDKYATIKAISDDMQKIPGIVVQTGKYADAKPEKILSLDYPVTLTKGMTGFINMSLPAVGDVYTTIDEVRTMLVPMGNPSIQNVGTPESQEFAIKLQQGEFVGGTPSGTGASSSDQSNIIDAAKKKLIELLSAKFESQTILIKSNDFVGPSFSKELVGAAVIAVIVAILLILIYVTFRFTFEFGLGGIIALVHDMLVMIGFIGVFQLEWNATTIAALLTILGYSINDTIVVYDRIRENVRLLHDQDLGMIIDTSITQTFSRTINTSLTVFLTVLPIFIFTNGTIKDFAFNMIVGVVSGTYSSIYIAAPIVLSYRNFFTKRKKDKLESMFGQKVQDKKAEKIIESPDNIVSSVEASDAITTGSNNTNNPQAQGGTSEFIGGRFHKKKKKKR